ncbi:MAG: hypothetical protein J4A00_06630, partial [Gammaproteobacteria bacterium]|nr:hypothetical protein [Gammaproteobacteria bacterium]
QLTRFGLYHDDIPISQGIFEPVSTLPSILGLLIFLVTALSLRKRQPLIALGLFWFLGGHLLESTFIPLEIAHEHRNYLPSAGLLLALVGGVAWAADSQQKNRYWLLLPLVIISLAGLTAVRAWQWGDYQKFVALDSLHHPDSARTQNELAALLYRAREYPAATEAAIRAAQLAPKEAAYILNAQLVAGRAGGELPDEMLARTPILLAGAHHSAMTQHTLKRFAACVFQGGCVPLLDHLEPWLKAAVDGEAPENLRNHYRHALGRVQIAKGEYLVGINTLQQANNLQPALEQPLFDLAAVFFELGQVAPLERVISQLDASHRVGSPSRDRALAQIKRQAEQLRRDLEQTEKETGLITIDSLSGDQHTPTETVQPHASHD